MADVEEREDELTIREEGVLYGGCRQWFSCADQDNVTVYEIKSPTNRSHNSNPDKGDKVERRSNGPGGG